MNASNLFPGLLLALVASGPVSAATLDECAAIADNAERLACYDQWVRGDTTSSDGQTEAPAPVASDPAESAPTGTPQTPAVVPVDPVPAAPATRAPVVTEPVEPVPPPSGQESAAAPAKAEAATDPDADFGAKYLPEVKEEEKKKKRKDAEMNSRIVGEFEGWSGRTVFPLENGQVWAQSGSGTAYYVATDPEVTITRGRFGGYTMYVHGMKRRVKVKRIK